MIRRVNSKWFSINIRRVRGEMEWSQKELGMRLGVSSKVVSAWEVRSIMPRLDMIRTVAELFGVRVFDLLSGKLEEAVLLSMHLNVLYDMVNAMKERVHNLVVDKNGEGAS